MLAPGADLGAALAAARRTADDFDAWLQGRGVRVATGVPAIPLVQNCPTPEGDKGDDDGDRVINCLDQCPASLAGQAIGLDGCPVAISIDLQGVTFAYALTPAVSDIDLTIDTGEIVALVGPNEVGKTSLLKALTHLNGSLEF